MATPEPTGELQAEPTPMPQSRAEKLLQEGAPQLLWTFQPDEPEVTAEGRPLFLMPALIGRTVCVGAPGGYIFVLHPENGENLWSFQSGGNFHGAPAQLDCSILFGLEDGNLYAVDAATGTPVWRFQLDETTLAALSVTEGMVYVSPDNGNLYALKAPQPAPSKASEEYPAQSCRRGYNSKKHPPVPNCPSAGRPIAAGKLSADI